MYYIVKFKMEDDLKEIITIDRSEAEDEIDMAFFSNEDIPSVVLETRFDTGLLLKQDLYKPIGLFRSYYASSGGVVERAV